ncbi:MAG: pyridoxamine 5'-phosphate oxidase family protein [Gammaproteobacteria bacterium]|nr:pyridoxamine 5'-phosphate oxidase family protein [Gammaproteobacteria bacterium]
MPSRRALISMTSEEIDGYLRAQKTIMIVSNGQDGFPHPMPMWFHVTSNGVVQCATFAKSQKVLNFRRDPTASLLVESGEIYSEAKGVLIYARTQIDDDPDLIMEALVNINTRGTTVSSSEEAELRARLVKIAQKRVLLSFHPERYVSWDHAKLNGGY